MTAISRASLNRVFMHSSFEDRVSCLQEFRDQGYGRGEDEQEERHDEIGERASDDREKFNEHGEASLRVGAGSVPPEHGSRDEDKKPDHAETARISPKTAIAIQTMFSAAGG
jgi:hypothetical protein